MYAGMKLASLQEPPLEDPRLVRSACQDPYEVAEEAPVSGFPRRIPTSSPPSPQSDQRRHVSNRAGSRESSERRDWVRVDRQRASLLLSFRRNRRPGIPS